MRKIVEAVGLVSALHKVQKMPKLNSGVESGVIEALTARKE